MNLKHIPKHYLSLVFLSTILLLSGCATTAKQNSKEHEIVSVKAREPMPVISIDGLDAKCHSDVLQRENSIGASAGVAQQIALAKAATRCIENKSFYPKHPDNQRAMQLSALAVVNYIKAGETQLAKQSLGSFRAQFPQQDLLYADYTSFVDTALALLEYKQLSAHQLQTLNINQALRTELKRQQYWLSN
jgi:hypothetical protein